jgi:regulatory protein YycH of two-component signal transduction system YycFG
MMELIMALETVITTVLLIIAIVLTIDVFKRLKVLEEIDELLDSAIETQKETLKTKGEMEAELYKFKLIKEAETNHKEDIDKFKRNVFGEWEEK